METLGTSECLTPPGYYHHPLVIHFVPSGNLPEYLKKHPDADRLILAGVISKGLEGQHPGRPRGPQGGRFPDGVWEMPGHCWENQPNDRPGLNTVLHCLQDVAPQWTPPPTQKPTKETAAAVRGVQRDLSCYTARALRTDPGIPILVPMTSRISLDAAPVCFLCSTGRSKPAFN